MIFSLVTGTLFRNPESKLAKNGKTYAVATIISKDGDSSTFANVVAFSDTAKDAILALRAGDALSVQGKATLGVYEKNGEHRPSISIVADQVLALRQPPKERNEKTSGDAASRGGAAAFDDSIPFGAP